MSLQRKPPTLPIGFRPGYWLGVLVFAIALKEAAGAEDFQVLASRQGSAVAINAQATIQAPLELIWATLTDYDRLSEFIPGIDRSHVVGRRGGTAVVEQQGSAGFLFFDYAINVVVDSIEEPPYVIGVKKVQGNIKQLEGHYQIDRLGDADDRYILRWIGVIEPDLFLPAFMSEPLIRANVAEQFLGMVKEIERRQGLKGKNQSADGSL